MTATIHVGDSLQAVLDGKSRWCVLERDALAVLASLPDQCVDAVITDPPYSSGGMFRGDRMQSTKIKYVQNGSVSGSAECAEFSGDSRDQRAFVTGARCGWARLFALQCLER